MTDATVKPLPRELEGEEGVRALLEKRDAFLSFLESRVGERALAEDVLQDALARGIEKAAQMGDATAATRWFYAVLRNAATDVARRRGAARRALDAFAHELSGEVEPPVDIAPRRVCQCVRRVADGLRPEYAEALRRIEVEGASVKDYAGEAGITPGNAAVRVFRARQALKREVVSTCGACAGAGCGDCTCGH